MKRKKKGSLKGKTLSDRYGREICVKSGEGMSLDTLFLSGRIDVDTYFRYLLEFNEQQRRGVGCKANAKIVDGKMYYEMSDKKDYFFGGLHFDDWCIYHPFEEVCDEAANHLPLPDYRNLVVREVEKSHDMIFIPYSGMISVEGERWMPSGSMTMPPLDSPFDESLDDYLKRVEEHPQSAL